MEQRFKSLSLFEFQKRFLTKEDCLSLGRFMKHHIDLKAKVTTDQWSGYGPLTKDFENMVQILSGKKGNNFPDLHRVIMMLKVWLMGMHHHLDEYCYRFNLSFMKEGIFDNLMLRMVKANPCYIKNISS